MENSKIQLKTENGNSFDIPVEGSLGLLALGYVGIMLWREKRKAVQAQKQETKLI